MLPCNIALRWRNWQVFVTCWIYFPGIIPNITPRVFPLATIELETQQKCKRFTPRARHFNQNRQPFKLQKWIWLREKIKKINIKNFIVLFYISVSFHVGFVSCPFRYLGLLFLFCQKCYTSVVCCFVAQKCRLLCRIKDKKPSSLYDEINNTTLTMHRFVQDYVNNMLSWVTGQSPLDDILYVVISLFTVVSWF